LEFYHHDFVCCFIISFVYSLELRYELYEIPVFDIVDDDNRQYGEGSGAVAAGLLAGPQRN
jgi:hypothetical protein